MDIEPIRRQSLIAMVSLIVNTAIGYIATVYFAHTLGPGPLGILYLLISTYAIATLFTDVGFGGAAQQRISEGDDRDAYFSAHLAVRTALVVAVIPALFLVRPLFPDLDGWGIFDWLVLAILVGYIANTAMTGVYGAAKVGVTQSAEVIGNLVKIGIQLVAVILGFGTAGLLGGFIAGIVAGAAVNLLFLDCRLVRFRWEHICNLSWYASWAFFNGFTAVITSYADTIVVGLLLDDVHVGMYRTVFQLATISLFSAGALRLTLYPRCAFWNHKGDRSSIEAAVARAFTFGLLLAVPAAIGGFILAEPAIYFLYGSAFTPAEAAFPVILVANAVSMVASFCTMCLFAANRPDKVFFTGVIQAGSLLALDFLWIPLFGITGAAVAVLISQCVAGIVSYWFVRPLVTIRVERQPLFHILMASAGMALVVGIIRLVVPMTHFLVPFVTTLAGVAVYAGLILRLDQGISAEIGNYARQFGIPWPCITTPGEEEKETRGGDH